MALVPHPTDAISAAVIGAAIAVHRHVGPGLLESTYQTCLAAELEHRGIGFEQEHAVAITYRSCTIRCAYRVDFLVERALVVELKAVERLNGVHEAQLLTYMRHLELSAGLLLNFHEPLMRDGIRRLLSARVTSS